MIFFNLFVWSTSLFILYIIFKIIWYWYLDNLTMSITKEWPGLDFPCYTSELHRDSTLISLSHRVLNPVIYYPFVYKGRYVRLITGRYCHRKWGDDTPGLRYQRLIIN